jgi:hypothetical protein
VHQEEMFEEFEDEFLKFERITEKLSQRPDIHAFILLDKLVPGKGGIIGGASHDLIGLDVDPEQLLKVATKDQLRDLHRCGVRYDSDVGGLGMFV